MILFQIVEANGKRHFSESDSLPRIGEEIMVAAFKDVTPPKLWKVKRVVYQCSADVSTFHRIEVHV